VPTYAGYEFNGWFDNPGFSGAAITAIPAGSTGNKIFYAKWSIITYSITYTPNGGIPVPPPVTYNVNSPTITMPAFDERCGWKFEGWFDNSGFSGTAITAIPTGSTGNKTLYAKWTNTPATPTINMLSYSQPGASSKTYDGSPVASVTAVSTSTCPMGAITILYNDAGIPTNAGTYRVEASIAANENYTAAKILLGSLTISKARVAFNISATVNDKEYDATAAATIKSIVFTPASTPYGDILTTSDYSASANFDSPNAGINKNVILNITWLNGPLSQNYILDKTIDPVSATIKKATNTVLEIEAKDYELSVPPVPPKITINKSPYISNSDIRIEYKRDGDANYVLQYPNRIGNWSVRATIDGNDNYEGKTDEKRFVVTRSNATTILHNIEFSDIGFYLDSAKSDTLRWRRRYYVAGTSLCNIKNTEIHITIIEPDIYLREGKKGENMQIESHPEIDGLHYKISFPFGKPGLDTLFYELFSREPMANNYSELDTILIETPVPFDTVVGQKWNNLLFVNNNPKTNGGYEFKYFKWFKNNEDIHNNLQYYSAGPSSADTLNPNDIYKVVMQTSNGIRISTCEGNAIIKAPAQVQKPVLKKQVLGIREKSLNSGSKVYNLNGKLTKETSAGVYIVEE